MTKSSLIKFRLSIYRLIKKNVNCQMKVCVLSFVQILQINNLDSV